MAAKEIFHSMSTSSSVIGAFALKIDISKAYNKVSWRFLSHCLRAFGIVGKSHEMIMKCVSTASFSLIINSQAEGFFTSERGLRQGCPLSPYLFILCTQGLSWLMRTMENDAPYNGYRICRNAPSVSHLMFADDLILFGNLDEMTIDTFRNILGTYALWSGQYENMQKSAIHFSKDVRSYRREEIANRLGVKQMQLTDKYLGYQILRSSYRIDSFDFLIDKFDCKIAGWKRIHLSYAGRTVMIKHVLGLIPPYYIATSIIPKKVLDRLTRTMRNLLVGTCK